MTKIIEIINKNNLSWKAKGIYVMIHDNYKNMDITVDTLIGISTDSVSSITSGIRELLDLGFIKRVTKRENGKFHSSNYIICGDCDE